MPVIDPIADDLPFEVDEFLMWLAAERGRRPNTLAAYRRDLRTYCVWLAEASSDLLQCDTAVIQTWIVAQRASGAPTTVARRLAAVRMLHRFLAVEGHRGDDPTANIDGVRVPAGIPKPLSIDAMESLLEAPASDSASDRRDRALIEMMYATGARAAETVGLNLGDIDSDRGVVRLLGKGGKERIVPFGGAAARAVATWLSTGGRDEFVPRAWKKRSDSEALFLNTRGSRLSRQGLWTIISGHATTAGLIDHVTPHVLRHTCATHLLDGGMDVRIVQEMLGHASISTTQVYTKVSQEHLFEVYATAHPRARRS